MHPMARPGTNDKLNGISPGERFVMPDGRRGTLDQAIENGARGFATLDDGNHVLVDVMQAKPEAGPPEGVTLEEDLRWPQDFRWERGQYVRTREPYE